MNYCAINKEELSLIVLRCMAQPTGEDLRLDLMEKRYFLEHERREEPSRVSIANRIQSQIAYLFDCKAVELNLALLRYNMALKSSDAFKEHVHEPFLNSKAESLLRLLLIYNLCYNMVKMEKKLSKTVKIKAFCPNLIFIEHGNKFHV